MDTHSVLEFRDIIVSPLFGVVWHMKGKTEVQSQNQEGKVIKNNYSSSQCNAVKEMPEIEFCTGASFIFAHKPYISCI